MTEIELIRLVGEIIGVIAAFFGGFLWIARLLWKTHTKLDGVNSRLDKLNGSVAKHEGELIAQKELNAWFSGVLGEPKPGEQRRPPA
jgi:hypothetical protein